MTPLDSLDAAEREATAAPWETKRWPHRGTEVIGPADPARPGHRHLITPKEASEMAALSRNHLCPLIEFIECARTLERIAAMPGKGVSGTGATGWLLTLEAPEIAAAALAPLLEPDDAA